MRTSICITFTGNRGDLSEMEANYDLMEGYNPKATVTTVTNGYSDLTPGDFTFEVQTIETSANSNLGGSFILSFEGQNTAAIAYNADGPTLKTRLEALPTIHTVNVVASSTATAASGMVWKVTFTHLNQEYIQGAGNSELKEDIATTPRC